MARHNNNKKPIIGVVINNNAIKQLLQQQKLPRLTELKDANKEAKVDLYFFSVDDVDFSNNVIAGIRFNEKKDIWERSDFTYPDFIYRTSSISKSKKSEDIIAKLLELKAKPLNYLRGFNKWDVYNELSKDKVIAKHLPKTCLYKSYRDLKQMLEISDKVYLKACRGGRGREVLRVTKLPKDRYELSYLNKKLTVYKIDNFNDLIKKVQAFYGRRKFIIQQAIDLITMKNRIVDLRAEVQKDGKGKIVIAAIPVRVGQLNAHITTHAESYPFDSFFKSIMNYTDAEVLELKVRLEGFLNTVYRCIEKTYGNSGEIGIDIGLDKKGRLWFIECNACSLKVSLYKAYDKRTIRGSYKDLLEYTKFQHRR